VLQITLLLDKLEPCLKQSLKIQITQNKGSYLIPAVVEFIEITNTIIKENKKLSNKISNELLFINQWLIQSTELTIPNFQHLVTIVSLIKVLVKKNNVLRNNLNSVLLDKLNNISLPGLIQFENLTSPTLTKSWFINKSIQEPYDIQKSWLFFKYLVNPEPKELKPKTINGMMKYRLVLGNKQKQHLRNLYYAYKVTYNKTMEYITDKGNPKLPSYGLYGKTLKLKDYIDFNWTDYDVRNFLLTKSNKMLDKTTLSKPRKFLANGVFNSFSNLQAALTNLKNGNITHFSTPFLRKKANGWCIPFPKDCFKLVNNKEFKLFSRTYKDITYKTKELITVPVNHEVKVQFNGLHYYLLVPYQKQITSNPNKAIVCALDPNLRNFYTAYGSDSNYSLFGDASGEILYNLTRKIDDLKANRTRLQDAIVSKRNLRKQRFYEIKINNYVKELHHKVALYLCNNYQSIVLPKDFGKGKLKEKTGIMSPKNKVKMIRLRHCAFRDLLIAKAATLNVDIHFQEESYTSQRCGKCHKLTVTSKEIYTCSHCSFTCHRDINSSRNILLKNLDTMGRWEPSLW
jgi:putative transposase